MTAFWVIAEIHINKIQCSGKVILVDLEGTGSNPENLYVVFSSYINQDLIIFMYSNYITYLLHRTTNIINTWLMKTI